MQEGNLFLRLNFFKSSFNSNFIFVIAITQHKTTPTHYSTIHEINF